MNFINTKLLLVSIVTSGYLRRLTKERILRQYKIASERITKSVCIPLFASHRFMIQ